MSNTTHFERETDVNATLSSRISSVSNIPSLEKASNVLNKKCNAALEKLKLQLASNPGTIENTLDVSFKELYAHNRCYALMEGLLRLYEKDPEITAEAIALTVDDMPVHWLVKAEYDGNVFYSDAYGVFETVGEIMERYQIQSEAIVDPFDPDDVNDPLQDDFSNLISAVHDDCATDIQSTLGNDNLDLAEVVNRCDFLFLRDAMISIDYCTQRDMSMSISM